MDEAPIERWYGIRCLFNWGKSREPGNEGKNVYEERIIVVESDSFAEAVEAAEAEAAEYIRNTNMEHMGFANAYFLGADKLTNRTEVFSLCRESELDPGAYIDRFFDTGYERQQDPQ